LVIVSRRVASIPLIVIGAIALVIGAVFASQGANLIHGSAMSGEPMWLYIGISVAVVGIVLIVIGLRRPKGGSTKG
jgi:xanthine/uracil permease